MGAAMDKCLAPPPLPPSAEPPSDEPPSAGSPSAEPPSAEPPSTEPASAPAPSSAKPSSPSSSANHEQICAPPSPAPPKDETKSLPKPVEPARRPSWFGTPAKKESYPTPASGFRSKRIGVDNTSSAPQHDSMGIDWEGEPTGGSHMHADVLGYSAADYLHSREQLVSMIERGLKPPQSLFVQLEACAHKMSEADLREEYKWYVATYLSENSSLQLKGACEMLVIKLGEIVSLPLAARLARKATDKRLSESNVTPRQAAVVEHNLGPGGSRDYAEYTALRQEALEMRRKGHRVKQEVYSEIDLRMYTLPSADMVAEYKYLAQIYLDYEISLDPSEVRVRGFVELRLMRLGELLYMPLQLRVAAIRADAVLSKVEKLKPQIVSNALLMRKAEPEIKPEQIGLAPPNKPPPRVVAMVPQMLQPGEEGYEEPTAEELELARELMPHKPDTTPREYYLTSEPPMTPSQAAIVGARQLPLPPSPVDTSRLKPGDPGYVPPAVPPRRVADYTTPGKPFDRPYMHGQAPVDMLRDIAALGGAPDFVSGVGGDGRPAVHRAEWMKGELPDGAGSLMAAETTQRSGVPKWLQKLRLRENLGGRRRDADQLRLLDLAAEAASQAAFHGLQSGAAGALGPGSIIETEGTDSRPKAPRYEQPGNFMVKDQLISELSGFLQKAGGAGGNVRGKLKPVTDSDKKSWFLREADRLRLQQIASLNDRSAAIEKLEREREETLKKQGIGGRPVETIAFGARNAGGRLPGSPPVFVDRSFQA